MDAPILVTGAQGFVGAHLLAQLGSDARQLEADVTDAAAIAQELEASSPTALGHLAALSPVGSSWEDVAETWRVNALGTVTVLEAVRKQAHTCRVLIASTGEVYGRARLVPTPEDEPPNPGSPYAASKAAGESAGGA